VRDNLRLSTFSDMKYYMEHGMYTLCGVHAEYTWDVCVSIKKTDTNYVDKYEMHTTNRF